MGTPPGGPGGEAEECHSGGAAYGAHTIARRQREGEVFPHLTILMPMCNPGGLLSQIIHIIMS